jgi:tetratricopeptide (TPR) repeat protein
MSARAVEDDGSAGAPAVSVSALARGVGLARVLAVVALVLWQSLFGQLVYDDLWLVTRNPALQSVANLPSSLGAAYWDLADPAAAARIGYWRPLTSVALFVGHALGSGSPVGFHAVSLAAHLIAVALAFLLAERLIGSTPIALFAALLFGLHPVQVEAVAWISAVNDPLGGALCLGALLAHLAWRERGSHGWPLAAPLLFALALLAKESAIAWIPLALAIDVGRRVEPPGERFRPVVRAFAPALIVLVAYWLARVAVFGDVAGGFDRVMSHLNVGLDRDLTLRLEFFGGALGLLVWPAHLNLFREVRPVITGGDTQLWIALGAIAAWLAATVWSWKREHRTMLMSLLFVPASLAPALLRIEAIGRFPLSERFLYLAVFGVALLVASVLLRNLPRVPAVIALGALALAYGVRSHARVPFWHDEETLYRESALQSPRSMYVQWGLGRVLLDKFQRTQDFTALADADKAFEAAQDLWKDNTDPSLLKTFPDLLQANLGYGWYTLFCAMHTSECTLDEAELVFRGILKNTADSEEAYCGLGVSLGAQGKLDEAEEAFSKAVELNPKHHESWFDKGKLALDRARAALAAHDTAEAHKRFGEALADFDKCVELAPDDVGSLVHLATAAVEVDAFDRARKALSRALELAPNDVEVRMQLGVLAAREKRFDNALEWFERALKIDGARGDAHLLRAKALLETGEPDKAITAFQDAIRYSPNEFEAFYDLGVLLLQRNQPRQALPFLERALELQPNSPYAAELRKQIDAIKSAPQDSKH